MHFTPHTRIRRSPYFAATVAAGVAGFTTYNHMLLPAGYGDPQGEYWRLMRGVSMWDVAAQRQVELLGPDAGRLAQILAPRDLSRCRAGEGKYVALCDHAGALINDPIALKLDDDKFWFSIADSDVLFWARAIAAERGLKVTVTEPDVSPLAVQGPQAAAVVASMFGAWARSLRYFHFRRADLDGMPLLLARSGWSKQGGFEIYLLDGARGMQLWNTVAEAGAPWDIAPGAPNANERIESGLLSWGGDTDAATNPFEVRLGKFVDLEFAGADAVVSVAALRRIKRAGPARRQLGVVLDGDVPAPGHPKWYAIEVDGRKVGDMTNGIWSYRLARNIGFGLVARALAAGMRVEVVKDEARVGGELVELPFA